MARRYKLQPAAAGNVDSNCGTATARGCRRIRLVSFHVQVHVRALVLVVVVLITSSQRRRLSLHLLATAHLHNNKFITDFRLICC